MKTCLASAKRCWPALARSIDCTFHRIQFTPDLLPSDLIGTSVFHQPTSEFVFKPGPLFAHIVLADEINRASPRTQSALLEAMSDRQVSVDGQTRPLGPPVMVLATQNPFEFEGTFPLPESQTDRFMMRLRIGYPDGDTEKEVLRRHRDGEPVAQLQPVIDVHDVQAMQALVRQVRFEETLNDYLMELIHATRKHPSLYLGASTRAALALYRAAQAFALLNARFVIPTTSSVARPVLAHRLLAKTYRHGERGDAAEVVTTEISNRRRFS